MVQATRGSLQGDTLYEAVVASRTRCNIAQSRAIVRRAHESVEGWGGDREAKFIDVVHCMIVSEYLSQNADNSGMNIDIRALLQSRIDPRL